MIVTPCNYAPELHLALARCAGMSQSNMQGAKCMSKTDISCAIVPQTVDAAQAKRSQNDGTHKQGSIKGSFRLVRRIQKSAA